jgi:hypothetical protein
MGKLTRRRILAAIPGTCVAALASVPEAGAGDLPAVPKTELFALGPFLLGKWVTPGVAKSPFGALTGGSPPDFEEVVKSLNECRLFVVDGRTIEGPKSPSFSKQHLGELSAAGKMCHIWKSTGTDFSIVVSKLELHISSTRERMTPATKVVLACLELNVHTSGFIGRSEATYKLSKDITYDVLGRILKGPE